MVNQCKSSAYGKTSDALPPALHGLASQLRMRRATEGWDHRQCPLGRKLQGRGAIKLFEALNDLGVPGPRIDALVPGSPA